MTQLLTAPETIYLQTGCDDPDCNCSFNEWGDVTWCGERIHDSDIAYTRADIAAPVPPDEEVIRDAERYRWLKENSTDEQYDGALKIRFVCDFDNWDNLDAALDAAMKKRV